MATKVAHAKSTKKPSSVEGPYAFQLQGKDGLKTVCLGNLHVLISHHEDSWLAQGLEIDYAIDGATVDDVKKRFEEGLTLTIQSHLRVYGDIRSLLRVAPQPIWDKFYAAVPPDLQHHQALLTVHELPKKRQHVLPFDRIVYAQAA